MIVHVNNGEGEVRMKAAREFGSRTIRFKVESSALDGMPLETLVPMDRNVTFSARWEDRTLVLEVASDTAKVDPKVLTPTEVSPKPLDKGEVERLAAMKDEDLRTLAAERGVRWDYRCSRTTMVERVAAAK